MAGPAWDVVYAAEGRSRAARERFGDPAHTGRPRRPPGLQSGSSAADTPGMEPTKHPERRAGFSLLELMVAVAIIGTLATIAIPMFMAHQLRSKSAEAKTNLGAITVAERAHFSESGAFLTVAAEPGTIPGSQAVPFDSAGSGFAQLGFAPEGNVYFSYGATASTDGTGYTVDAGADIDANGVVQFWGYTKADGSGALPAGQVGCDATQLTPLSIGPCDVAAGRSVF